DVELELVRLPRPAGLLLDRDAADDDLCGGLDLDDPGDLADGQAGVVGFHRLDQQTGVLGVLQVDTDPADSGLGGHVAAPFFWGDAPPPPGVNVIPTLASSAADSAAA